MTRIEEERIVYRHAKRGTDYELIGIGKMQAQGWYRHNYISGQGEEALPVDMREVAVYRSLTDPTEIWVRPREEFEDGRFIRVDTPPELKELRAQGGVMGLDRDSRRILGRFADQYRSGAQGAEMDYEAAQMLALAIDDALSALETEAVEPVAWQSVDIDGKISITRSKSTAEAWDRNEVFVRPLYAHPPHSSIPTVTDAMVEWAAKALYEEDDVWSAAFPWPDTPMNCPKASDYRRLARAALTAALSSESKP